jgi:hypothetical protein
MGGVYVATRNRLKLLRQYLLALFDSTNPGRLESEVSLHGLGDRRSRPSSDVRRRGRAVLSAQTRSLNRLLDHLKRRGERFDPAR